jgi:NAD(P)-dependent dehydrogenase (short-subunit alcohol dehydrogenase family)
MVAMAVAIDLGGKRALVTGAGAGIGREVARWLARAGASVTVNDIDGDAAAETVRLLEAEGNTAAVAVADTRDPGQVEAMVGGAAPLDVAVNNVGMMAGRRAAPFVATAVEDAWAVIEQNLRSTYQCCLAEAGVVRAGGVIVNVSSGETTRPAVGLAAYGAAKAAVNHLTATLAAELGPRRIRVMAVAPGTTFTASVRSGLGDEHFAAVSASTPLGRVCEPDELARLTVFLASDLARCITGQLILADAGAHLGRLPLAIDR